MIAAANATRIGRYEFFTEGNPCKQPASDYYRNPIFAPARACCQMQTQLLGRISSSMFSGWEGLFLLNQQAGEPADCRETGTGAPSSADIFAGEQHILLRRARSACIAFSSLRTANVSRRIFAAPGCAGITIL